MRLGFAEAVPKSTKWRDLLVLSRQNVGLGETGWPKPAAVRPGVPDVAAPLRRFPAAAAHRPRGIASGRPAPDCGPDTAHADTLRPRCLAPRRRCRRPHGCA